MAQATQSPEKQSFRGRGAIAGPDKTVNALKNLTIRHARDLKQANYPWRKLFYEVALPHPARNLNTPTVNNQLRNIILSGA
ncbi:MAG: hypothetical protein AAGC96_06925 [Pseudomonadota bacterium]